MGTLRAILLIPVAYAGAFTLFPFFEAAMLPRDWWKAIVLFALLTPAYGYVLCGICWLRGRKPEHQFLGLSPRGWMISMSAAYLIGAGSVFCLTLS